MSKPLSETKQGFEALVARVPDPAAVSTEQQLEFMTEAFSLVQDAEEAGVDGRGLRDEILIHLAKLVGESSSFGVSANLLFDKFTARYVNSCDSA